MQHTHALALWPLPLLCAAIPVLAAHVAFALSAQAGHVPDCMPYLEGCTSISRAARHGLGNHVFRGLMLPCALLQWLHWIAARHWLRAHAPDPAAGSSLLALGAIAGIALGLYANFLGTEGDGYRFMRNYGVKFYFAATYLAQLVFLRRLRELAPAFPGARHAMLAIALALLALGLGSTAVTGLVDDELLKDQLENLMEWHLGLLVCAWFVVNALLWRQTRFRLQAAVD